MARRVVFVLLALVQFASVTPGGAGHSGFATALASVVGLAGGAVLFLRPGDAAALLVVAGLYAVQAMLVGPVLPAVVAAAVSLVAARPASDGSGGSRVLYRQFPVMLAVVVVAVAAAVTGSAATGLSYAVALLVAVVAGLLFAARTSRLAVRERDVVASERLRIARDLHDVVGHGLTAITVQAGTGRVALEGGAMCDAREALVAVETAGRQVLREVRWLVSLLREDSARPALSDLAALVADAQRCGAHVDLVRSGPTPAVTSAVGEAAYRIVQESLTNVLRHAPAATTLVRIGGGDVLVVEVTSNGPVSASAVEGAGIRGMRERATAMGGTLAAGPGREGSTWTVRAELPTQRRP